MPPWVTALVVLVLITGLGAYIITEGFATAQTTCRSEYSKCFSACSGSDLTCIKKCGDTQTSCLSAAVSAASVANTGPMNTGYANSRTRWAASVAPGAQGNSNATHWYDSFYRSTLALPSVSSTPVPGSNATPVSTTTPGSTTPGSTASPVSGWDGNRDMYSTGWPQQIFSLQDDGAYDSNAPVEGSYLVNVRRWKPHETPTQETPGLRANAPTDEGTGAAELKDTIPSLQQMVRDDSLPSESLQELISEDVKNTVNGLFKNQYEIQYAYA